MKTSKEFIDNFDNFTRSSDKKTVVIHPGLEYGFIELTPKFVEELKKDLSSKIMMAHAGLERLSPTDRFAIMMLDEAY